jgi:hypothetical protein
LVFLEGFLGIKAGVNRLEIRPNLPSGMAFAGVREYCYGGRTYSIQASKNVSEPSVVRSGDSYFVKLPAGKGYGITRDNRLIVL